MDDDKLFLNEYSGLSNLLGVTNSASLGAEACPADASDCSTDSCPSDCKNDCSDCRSDCSSDCSSDCRSDCRSDCSDTPSYLVYVETFLDGYSYDLAGRSYTVQSRTVSSWKSAVGVDTPPNSNFVSGEYYRGGTHGSCSLSTSLRNSATLEIYLYYESAHTPITITGGSLSASTITSGDSITMTWTTSGDKESIGSWQLTRTDTSTYTNPVSIGSYDQDHAKSHTMTWGPIGTYYIWVFYYGETGSSTYTSNVYCIGTLTVNPAPVKYTLSVYSYLNGTLFDSGTVSNVTSGTTNTCMGWASAAGVDMPSAPAEFQKFNWAGNDFTNLATSLTVSSNTTLRIYYILHTSNVTIYVYDGGWKKVTPYVYDGGWKEVTADIYDGGWQNE